MVLLLSWAPANRDEYAASSRFLAEHPVGASPGRGPVLASLHRQSHAAPGRLPSAHSVGASPGRGLCHASLHQRACAFSRHLLPAQLIGSSPGRGPSYASLPRQIPHYLQLSTTGEPCWCGSRVRPPANRDHYTASGRLPSAQTVGASLGRGPYHASLHRQRPCRLRSSPPASTQLVHSQGGGLATPPSIGTLAPSPVIFYRRNLLVHPRKGAPLTPPSIVNSHSTSYYRTTLFVLLPGWPPCQSG